MDSIFDDLTRREALKRAALLVGGAIAAPTLASCRRQGAEDAAVERSGAAPAVGAPSPRRPIGLQLYTIRDRMQQDAAATLASVAEIGYSEVETHDLYGLSPEQFRGFLDRHGLVSPSGHYPIDGLRQSLDTTFATAQTLGQNWVIVAWLPESERTLPGYRRVAADLNRFGRAAQERGMRMAYHNHEFEFVPVAGGPTGYEVLLEETDAALVDFELDLFWTVHAGQDPLELIARHQDRQFPLWHVKDMADIQGEKRMVAVGQGEIDFARTFARAEELGLRHFFVEHDNPEDSLASIRTSYQHVRQLLS